MPRKVELLQFRFHPLDEVIQLSLSDSGSCERFGASGPFGGVAGAAGITVLGGASDNAFRMNPGGTAAVRIARSPDCSTLRLSKNIFTSASVPWAPTLPSA